MKWYMEKLGAQAEIPSKNSSEKPDGADADVIATFDKLNVALYIQVKKHDIGTLSDEEAVDQVLRYTLEIENNDENVTLYPLGHHLRGRLFRDGKKEGPASL